MKFRFGLFLAAAVLAVSAGALPPEGLLDFQAPSVDSPAYLIRAVFEVKTAGLSFNKLSLNEKEFREFSLLKGGKPVDTSKLLDPGRYDLVLRYAWQNAVPYLVAASCVSTTEQWETRIFEWRGISPPFGGARTPEEEGFFAPIVIEENAGIERRGEIVYPTLTAPKSEIQGADFVVYDGERKLAYQILETRESVPPESQARTHPVTLTLKLALAVDVRPREKKLLRVFKGPAGPTPPEAFSVTGQNLGKTVKGGNLTLRMHPQSGQILTIEDSAAGVQLINKDGPIHWNPDVFIPGLAWDHSFDWNPPQSFEEKSGAFVYLNARKGPLPHIRDVFLEVKYTLEKGAPCFLAETRLRVDRDLGVIALRNDEMVLFKDLFDTLVYRDTRGSVIKRPLKEMPDKPFGLAHIAPSEIEWVGLLNSKAGYGFFSLRLESSASNLDAGGLYLHRPGTYFYAPSDGDYVYWVRPWNYTWGEFATSNHLTALPAGTLLYEKNAYLVSRWSDSTPALLESLLKRLKNPLRVF